MLSIEEQIKARGIRWLCHATRISNLPSIQRHNLISREWLSKTDIDFVGNDQRRLDGRPDLISCTLEVPNAKYLRTVGGSRVDWVVLLIEALPELTRGGTRFAPQNAARAGGRGIAEGPEGFERLFADTDGIQRGPAHHPACPTDLQAEALVKNYVRLAHIKSLVVASQSVASKNISILEEASAALDIPLLVCPTYFQADELTETIRRGELPRPIPLGT